MQLNAKQIRSLVFVILLVIVGGQLMWGYNLYRTQYKLITQVKDEALQKAILQEHAFRYQATGGTIVFNPLTYKNDTARYITKTVRLQDTSFTVIHDRQDPYSDIKLNQFILKDHMPVNVTMVDSLFQEELHLRGIREANTYIEYIDINNNEVLQQSDLKGDETDYTSSALNTIDIFKTLGIKGYINIPASAILKPMSFQLALTLVLVVVCSFLLSLIIRTFFWKEKIERIRRESVKTTMHEFKRPISAAMAKVSLIPIYMESKPDKAKLYAEQSILELNRLNAYTQRIQQLSNNQQHTIVLQKTPIALRNFFASILERYEQTESDKLVELTLDFRSEHSHIMADILHFSNIVDNLIENAIKYGKPKAVRIQVVVTDEADRLCIAVMDDGLGISKTDLPYIFNTFYRSKNKAKRNKPGFGLGLTYVQAMVDAHQGEVRVTSTLGEGSTFRVYLPIENHAKQDITD